MNTKDLEALARREASSHREIDAKMAPYKHDWNIGGSDWDDLPEDVVGCATCRKCGRQ